MWKIERIGMRNEEKENPRNSINDFDKKISQLNEINRTIPQLQDTQEQRRGIQEPLRQHARHTCLPWGNGRYALPGTGDPPCCSEKWPFSPHRILEFCPYPPLMKRTTGRFWCRRRRGTSEKIKCNEVGLRLTERYGGCVLIVGGKLRRPMEAYHTDWSYWWFDWT